jgi:hypothetical protein
MSKFIALILVAWGLVYLANKLNPPTARARTSATHRALPKSSRRHAAEYQGNNLRFLDGFNGKDPSAVGLLNHPVLKRRLRKLLGSQYTYVKGIWEVETPIEVEDGIFYADGMQAHGGGDPGAVVMADIAQNVLYVGIRQDHQVQLYAEDGGAVPPKLQEWANEED